MTMQPSQSTGEDASTTKENVRRSRSTRRVIVGIIAIFLGSVSLIGFSSTAYYYGLGIFGGAYGAVMIALGIALIAKKETVPN